jgi:hypothetical protein
LTSGAIQDAPESSYAKVADDIKKFRPMTIKYTDEINAICDWLDNESDRNTDFGNIVKECQAHCKRLSELQAMLRPDAVTPILKSLQACVHSIFEMKDEVVEKTWDTEETSAMQLLQRMLHEASCLFPFDPALGTIIITVGDAVQRNTTGERKAALMALCAQVSSGDWDGIVAVAATNMVSLCGNICSLVGVQKSVESMVASLVAKCESVLPEECEFTMILQKTVDVFGSMNQAAETLDLHKWIRRLSATIILLQPENGHTDEAIKDLHLQTKLLKTAKKGKYPGVKPGEDQTIHAKLFDAAQDLIDKHTKGIVASALAEITSLANVLNTTEECPIRTAMTWQGQLQEAQLLDHSKISELANTAFRDLQPSDFSDIETAAKMLSQALYIGSNGILF